jgi:hypothetical protein
LPRALTCVCLSRKQLAATVALACLGIACLSMAALSHSGRASLLQMPVGAPCLRCLLCFASADAVWTAAGTKTQVMVIDIPMSQNLLMGQECQKACDDNFLKCTKGVSLVRGVGLPSGCAELPSA